MVDAFDTLGFSKRLRDAGVPQPQAEAQAEAARDFIMAELVTKTDLQSSLAALEGRLDARIEALSLKLDARIETLSLRLSVRLGIMLVAAVSILAAIIKLS